MWSTLALLLVFGAGIGVSAPECTLYELPVKDSCEKIIKWKVHSHDQALATCLEHFPTTFVKGEMVGVGDTSKCTVKAAYQCIEPETFLMFDKCYKFPKVGGKYVTGKMSQYDRSDGTDGICGKGKLSVFYSSSHAKFVGMKAHKLGIDKLWIGITSDGRTIEKNADGEHMKIHSKLWNLVEGDYWENGKLKKGVVPDTAKYFFMRTDTDYVLNRWQGKFEQTDGNTEAAFACEYESKYLADLRWYCDKLPELGIDSVYDNNFDSSQPQCLYVTAGKYTFNGKHEDMQNIKGCLERPSDLHSAGMDDGTGKLENYEHLMRSNGGHPGPLRVAAYKEENDLNWNGYAVKDLQKKCTTGPVSDEVTRFRLYAKWRHIGHHGAIQLSAASQVQWSSSHPANECSDFPGDSSTMGMKDGKKIDMPPQVRAPAICSLKFFQECEQKKPCGMKECTNLAEYNLNTGHPTNKEGFFKCQCPGPIVNGASYLFDEGENNGQPTCTWKPAYSQYCAWLRFHDDSSMNLFALLGSGRGEAVKENLLDGRFSHSHNDKLNQVVVRQGCYIDILAASLTYHWNHELLNMARYGTHHVPNYDDGTLVGAWAGMGASAYICRCKV